MDTTTLTDVAATTSQAPAAAVAIGAVVGLAVTALGSLAVFRLWRTPVAELLRSMNRWPRLAVGASLGALVGLGLALPPDGSAPTLRRVLVLLLIATSTWYALSLLRAVERAAISTWDTSHADNLHARRRRTQFLVLRRAGSAVVVVVALATALLTFPSVRAVGQSLLASAGVLGIVVGVAAQGSLKNLVAGIQIAVAQPIKLGDAVFVDDEWGTIEDITLTTVVVEVWDRRRLVFPTSWFTEHPFENWTRSSAQLLGQVTLVLDHAADVAALREAAERIVAAHPSWDGDVWVLQVVEADTDGIVVRALMSARDAGTAWELRCDVRESLLAWLVANQPAALPRHRLVEVTDTTRAVGQARPPADATDDAD